MADAERRWSVDDLAAEAGTTVRNVRLYQERGLLPPPRREGRRGWYGPDHLERLRLVLAMLKRGYPLTAIRELIEAWDARHSLGQVLGFDEALAAPYTTESPRRLTLDELAALFPEGGPPILLRAIELEVVVPDGDGFIAPSPAFLDTGAQLVADGVPADVVLDSAAAIREATDALAQRFVGLFVDHVWQPFVDAGMPSEDLGRITGVLERQRPLATQAVVAALAQSMQRHTDAAAGAARAGLWPAAAAEEHRSA
ncbi:MAG: MerR family transcriptional regulator [Acidimicrobiales bacterium]